MQQSCAGCDVCGVIVPSLFQDFCEESMNGLYMFIPFVLLHVSQIHSVII